MKLYKARYQAVILLWRVIWIVTNGDNNWKILPLWSLVLKILQQPDPIKRFLYLFSFDFTMSDVVFGCFVFGAFLVIFFFNVGFLTPYWIEEQETNATNIISNSTNSSTPSPTARTCHHGLFYSLDCPESQNGK